MNESFASKALAFVVCTAIFAAIGWVVYNSVAEQVGWWHINGSSNDTCHTDYGSNGTPIEEC